MATSKAHLLFTEQSKYLKQEKPDLWLLDFFTEKFNSIEHMIHCVITSCHIPGMFRGVRLLNYMPHIDGGILNYQPTLSDSTITASVSVS